jgi:hypothetical protein
MPEFVLQLWAAMVFTSGRPYHTLFETDLVPRDHRMDVGQRVSAMQVRWSKQLYRARHTG